MKISQDYFENKDVLFLAEDLLGKYIFTLFDGQITGGIITETEAYRGITDRASHAFNGRRTNRNEVMYARGGTLYVYLCYGIHHLSNIVTNQEGVPDAILLRAIVPTHGEELILKRTGKSKITPDILEGPGKLSKGLGISTAMNGLAIGSDKIWLEDRQKEVNKNHISKLPRIGVEYAAEDALLPYRFVLAHEHFLI